MKTPRTDAARFHLVCHFDQGGVYDANPKRANDGEWVPVEVCEQLETELAAMTALANRLAEALEASDECLALLEDVGHGAHMNNVSVARGYVQKRPRRLREPQETDIMTPEKPPKKCRLCKRPKGLHKAKTLNCPIGRKSRVGFIHFSTTDFYTP